MKSLIINGKDFTNEELSKLIEDSGKPKYPVYCQHLPTNEIIVKFTGLSKGVVVKNGSDLNECPVGLESSSFIKHTHKNVWKLLPVCPKTGFFHGQLIWAWANAHTHHRALVFYDAENSCLFSMYGKKNSFAYSNYLPFEGNWPDWALEAYETLKL